MLSVPSYGYAVLKPLKCEKRCSIESNSDGTFVLRNEFLSAKIDNMGRIVALFLEGEERFVLICFMQFREVEKRTSCMNMVNLISVKCHALWILR